MFGALNRKNRIAGHAVKMPAISSRIFTLAACRKQFERRPIGQGYVTIPFYTANPKWLHVLALLGHFRENTYNFDQSAS